MKVKEWFRKLVAGLAIGTGAAIPGVSGAAIAVIFRVYEDIIAAVNNFRKKFGWAITVLIPILLGTLIAVAICIVLFHLAFEHFMFVLMCLFAGFLIGSFPGVTDEVKGEKIDKACIILIVCGALFVIALGILSVFSGLDVKVLFQDPIPWWLYLLLIPVGALAAIALTVPGLSGSLILLIIGFYRPLVDSAVAWAKEIVGYNVEQSFDHVLPLIGVIGCFGIGCLIGVIFVSKVMSHFLKKWRKYTFFTIIGFIGGSIFVLFFNHEIYGYYKVWVDPSLGPSLNIEQLMPMYLEIIIGVVVAAVAAVLSYLLVRAQRKRALENKEEQLEAVEE